MSSSSQLIFHSSLSFSLPRKWCLSVKYPPSECLLNTYSLTINMLFLSSSHSSSSVSSTFSTSPLRLHHVVPTLLPNYAVHLLYTGILTNPTILHIVEDLPLYDEDVICQELIRLFHLISSTQWYHALAAPSDLPAAFGIPLQTSLNAIPGHVLNLLHLHGFHTFVEQIPSNTIYPMFRQVFFSMTMEEHDHYLEQTELPAPISPLPVPIPPPSETLSSPSTLLSQLSSPPPSTGPASPTAIESESEYGGIDEEVLALNRSFLQSLPNGT